MKLVYECRVDADLEDLFRFHENPANLAVLHAGMPGFKLLAHSMEPCIARFVQTVYGVFPVVLQFLRCVFDPPNQFAEELTHGPFARFRHEHHFEHRGGGVIVRDVLLCELPWWFGGEFAVQRFVVPEMNKVFAFRHRALKRLVAEGVEVKGGTESSKRQPLSFSSIPALS